MSDSPLGQYVKELCDKEGLSLRQASIRAGLSPETVSLILRRGNTTHPRPQTLAVLMDALKGDLHHALTLAGYNMPPLIEYKIPRLYQFVNRLAAYPPEVQERIMDATLALLEITDAATASTPSVLRESSAPDTDDARPATAQVR